MLRVRRASSKRRGSCLEKENSMGGNGSGVPSGLIPVSGLVLLLSAAFAAPGAAADVNECFVRKMRGCSQVGTNPPALRPNPFTFKTDVYADSSMALAGGWIRTPNGTNLPLVWSERQYRLPSYSFEEGFSDEPRMDASYPGGNYTFELLTTHNGNPTNTLSLLSGVFPEPPWLRNLDAAQHLDPEADFSFTWTPFTEATTDDEIQFQLWKQGNPGTLVFSTDGYFSGTNTSIPIPRRTLAYGTTYIGFLVFLRISQSDTNSFPGVRFLSAYDSYTVFSFQTRPLPSLQITLDNGTATLAWPLFYDFLSLQETDDPSRPGSWRLLENPSVPIGAFYNVTVATTNTGRFYRLIRP